LAAAAAAGAARAAACVCAALSAPEDMVYLINNNIPTYFSNQQLQL
jgi:hypothetical protein